MEAAPHKAANVRPLTHINQPLRSGRIRHKVNFEAEFNEFEFQSFPSPRLAASPRLKKPVCPTIYPLRIIGFIPFPRVLVLCEMQLAWSKFELVSPCPFSYDDNHYTTATYYPSRKLSKLDEQDMGDTAGKVRTNS